MSVSYVHLGLYTLSPFNDVKTQGVQTNYKTGDVSVILSDSYIDITLSLQRPDVFFTATFAYFNKQTSL